MLDLGWSELMMVAVVTVIVVGPKELPRVLRTVNQTVRKVRKMAGEFQSSIDEMAREAELDDLQKKLRDQANSDMRDHLNTIDPSGETAKIVDDVKKTVETESKEANSVADGLREQDLLGDATPTKPAAAAEPAAPSPAKAQKTAGKKAPGKKAAAKKTSAKKATAKKAPAKKAAKKSVAKKVAVTTSAAKKAVAKKSVAKKPSAASPAAQSDNLAAKTADREAGS
ncbi:MAG: Sec-independent protein translocase protein TatB [Alphaproteobacteria bacterium]|nr:Sec-independent protein translocase protein TatB [Alphaproteobacteria bacterium]